MINDVNISKIIDEDFSGAISITQAGEAILQDAYGYADLPNKIPNEINTKFPTASAGKAFIAVGILQLIEKKLLAFDDSLGKLLKFDLKKIDKNITVRQLLTHTSGIPDYFDESVMPEYAELWKDFPNYKIRKSTDLLPLFINKPMLYPAGEKFQYNNSGYVVLGLIIEEVTSLAFDEYLKKYVFTPCEMFDTGYYELDRLPAKCANAYIYDEIRKEFYTNIYSVDVKGSGAGGAFTTVLNLDKFWACLLGKKLLSKDIINQMFSLQSFSDDNYYGYGVWLEKTEKGNYLPFFQGCDPGVSFISWYNTEKSLGLTIVSNKGDNVWKMKKSILDML